MGSPVHENERHGTEIAGIRFAPLRIPMERRLQTLAAGMCIFIGSLYFAGWPLIVYIIGWTKYWWMGVLYCLHIYMDRRTSERGGNRSGRLQGCKWFKYVSAYFPIRLFKVEGAEFDPNRNYLLCCFPHGICCFGLSMAFCCKELNFDKLFPGMQPIMIALDDSYHTPFFREFFIHAGCVSSSETSLNYILSERRNKGVMAGLVVGGSKEMLNSRPGNYVLVLKKRKGFVRVALRNGSALVPTLNFGEIELYTQNYSEKDSFYRRVQDYFRQYRPLPLALLNGRGFFQYSFGLVPKRRSINVVVGKPIDVPKVHEPSDELIDQYHKRFIHELTNLFETEKYKYIADAANTKLIIDT